MSNTHPRSRISSFFAAWRDYPIESNTQIGNRYLVHEMIGEGSYGMTYKCTDQNTGDFVAVKQARPSKGDNARLLLGREADVLKSLHHPQIPVFYDFFEDKSQMYLVMSYLTGDTLEDLIFEQARTYNEQECVRITLQLLNIVIFMHEQGFVHLDIRIPNVLFKNDFIYLIDFGLARKIDEPPPRLKSKRAWLRLHSTPSSSDYKIAEEQADLQDIGHFMLFMLYSAYEPDYKQNHSLKRSWREELQLSKELKEVIERLLGLRRPYTGSSQFMMELKKLEN